MQIGHIVVKCPSVLGETPSAWAMPAFPVAGPQMGAWWLPQIGASVWVEFEQGDRIIRSGPAAGLVQWQKSPRWRWPRLPACRNSSFKHKIKTQS